LSRRLYETSNQLKSGVWNKNGGVQLTGKTVGIIGAGNIGKEVIHLLSVFQCKILVNDIIDLKDILGNDVSIVDKDTLYSKSDIISIHTPLTEDTDNLIDLHVFKKMKRSAVLINTARGGIVNENALKVALQNSLIAGAAIDVYTEEPPNDLDLLRLPNLITTPHTGGNALEAVLAMGYSAIDHLVQYQKLNQ